MFVNEIEVTFLESQKEYHLERKSGLLEIVRLANPEELVDLFGIANGLPGQDVVVSCLITKEDEYVDSDEYFCQYNGQYNEKVERRIA